MFYGAANTARNKLFSEYYEYELEADNTIKTVNEQKIFYRIKDKNNIVIVNKIDLENKLNLNELSQYIEMSVKDDIGINELRNKIKEMFNLEQIEQNDYTYLSSARSISLLKKSLESLDNLLNKRYKNVVFRFYKFF